MQMPKEDSATVQPRTAVFRATRYVLAGVLVLAPLSVSECRQQPRQTDIDRLISAAAKSPQRSTVARLSGFGYQPFRTKRGGESASTNRVSTTVAFAARIIVASGGADTQTLGVAYLILGDISAAVNRLQASAPRANSAATWTNLAAALISRCDEDDLPAAAVDALAAADRALQIDRNASAALFNRALALERLGLSHEALGAWSEALAKERDSNWANEIREARERLRGALAPQWSESDVVDAAKRNDDRLSTLVKAHPREARSWGEGVFLGQWADAVLANDRAAAEVPYAMARRLAVALEETSGERLLKAATDRIKAAELHRAPHLALARAHVAYRAGRVAFSKQQLEEADRQLREAVRLFSSADSPMMFQAQYYLAQVAYERGEVVEAEHIARSISEDSRFRNEYREVHAAVGWVTGLCLVQRGSYGAAIATFDLARRLFHDLGETEREASMCEFLAAALDVIGDSEEAWRVRRDAWEKLSTARNDRRRIAAIAEAAERSIARGDWTRAESLAALAIHQAEQASFADLVAQSLVQRCLARNAQHDRDDAERDLTAARRWLARINDQPMRVRLEMRAAVASAAVVSERDPRRAAADLSAVLESAEQTGMMSDATRLYLTRGRIWRRAGDIERSRSDLIRALDLIEQRRSAVANPQQRALHLVYEQEVFAEAVSLMLFQGDVAAAFDIAERARARALLDMYEARFGGDASPLKSAEIQRKLADDAAILSFSILDDRIVAFVLRSDGLSPYEVNRATLGLVAPCTERIRKQQYGPGRKECSLLYQNLLGAAEHRLVGINHLVVINTGGLGDIPYGELPDRSGTPLNERFSISESPSVTIAIRCAERTRVRRGNGRALVVAATEFARDEHRNLSPLEWAAPEARDIAAHYRQSELITGVSATRSRLVAAISRAAMLHFAGHAIASSRRPDKSRLILSRSAGDSSDLDALSISRLVLMNAPIVYLSACRSGTAPSKSDGIENLALAFIVAGAPLVVAPRWDVDDRAAAYAARLVHKELARGEDAAVAVARAAREMRSQRSESTPHWPALTVFGGSKYLLR